MLARQLRTPRERKLFVISAVFSALVWIAVAVSIVGLLYSLLIFVFVVIAHCLLMAHVMGNGVRIGPRQLPDLLNRIETAARKLGLDKAPEAYVVQSGGLLNAFATKILSRRFIIIYSDLLEACEPGGPPGRPNELDFVVGHEIGHVAAGHLAYRWFLLPARILPLVGAAYSRACEYTCDRCGYAVVEDLAVASRALAILAAGPATARRMDLDAFVEQRQETGRFWMAVYELNASHPFLSKRVAALREWQRQGSAAPLGRNPWAYPFAPFFGAMTGNPAAAVGMVLVVFALAAAVALPRLKQQLGPLMGARAGLPAARDPGLGEAEENGAESEAEAMARFRKILEEAEAAEKAGARPQGE